MVYLEAEGIGDFYWSIWVDKTRLYGTSSLNRALRRLKTPQSPASNQSFGGNHVAYGPILEWGE